MTDTVANQTAYLALIQEGASVAQQTTYLALLTREVAVTSQTAYVALFPDAAAGGRRRNACMVIN